MQGKSFSEERAKMKNRRALIEKAMTAVAACLVLAWLAACGGAQIATGPQAGGASKAKPEAIAAQGDTAESDKPKITWSYDPTGKRDPFQQPTPEEVTPPPKPLTTYNLDQMWIDGIIVGAGRDIAHILLPDGTDWFIKMGDELGVNRGRVKQILPDGIMVEEQYLDPVDPQKIRIVEKFLKMEPLSTNIPILR